MTGRDISALLETGGFCACCHEQAPRKQVVPWVEAHVARHLADGSAVVVITTPPHGGRRTERVVPTSSLPDEPEPKYPRKPKNMKRTPTLGVAGRVFRFKKFRPE